MINKKLFWIYALNSSVYFLQGITGIAGGPLSYYLKETLHLSPSMLMYISSFTSLAWLVKPLIGLAIDKVGWSRRTWIIIALTSDILFAMLLGLWALPLFVLITAMMLANWNTCFRDVAVDGIMVVEGKKNNTCGKIQSVQWISVTIAGIISTLLGAWLAEKNVPYQIGFLLTIPFYLLGAIAVWKYREESSEDHTIYKTQTPNFCKLFTDKRFLLACLFIFLYKYAPSFGTPLWYIERDVFHWSKMWIGTLGAITSGVAIIGAWLYYKFESRLNLRQGLLWSIYLGVICSLAYLYFTPVTDVLYGIMFGVTGMFFHLIIMTVMARTCIKGLESTSFATLCAVSNIAGTASTLSGAYFLPIIGLQYLIVMSAVTSLICLPLLNFVIPKEQQNV